MKAFFIINTCKSLLFSLLLLFTLSSQYAVFATAQSTWWDGFTFGFNSKSYRVRPVHSEEEEKSGDNLHNSNSNDRQDLFVGPEESDEVLIDKQKSGYYGVETIFTRYLIFKSDIDHPILIGYYDLCLPKEDSILIPGIDYEEKIAAVLGLASQSEVENADKGWGEGTIYIASEYRGQGIAPLFYENLKNKIFNQSLNRKVPIPGYLPDQGKFVPQLTRSEFKGIEGSIDLSNIASLKFNLKIGIKPFRVSGGDKTITILVRDPYKQNFSDQAIEALKQISSNPNEKNIESWQILALEKDQMTQQIAQKKMSQNS